MKVVLLAHKKSPRQQSRDISTGKSKPSHIGKRSPAMLQQEFFSFVNKRGGFRDKAWLGKCYAFKQYCPTELFTQFQVKYQSVGLFPKDFSEIGK